jgi:hypothetical protein
MRLFKMRALKSRAWRARLENRNGVFASRRMNGWKIDPYLIAAA